MHVQKCVKVGFEYSQQRGPRPAPPAPPSPRSSSTFRCSRFVTSRACLLDNKAAKMHQLGSENSSVEMAIPGCIARHGRSAACVCMPSSTHLRAAHVDDRLPLHLRRLLLRLLQAHNTIESSMDTR